MFTNISCTNLNYFARHFVPFSLFANLRKNYISKYIACIKEILRILKYLPSPKFKSQRRCSSLNPACSASAHIHLEMGSHG